MKFCKFCKCCGVVIKQPHCSSQGLCEVQCWTEGLGEICLLVSHFEILFELMLERWAAKAPQGLNASRVLSACPQTLRGSLHPGSQRKQEAEGRLGWKYEEAIDVGKQ